MLALKAAVTFALVTALPTGLLSQAPTVSTISPRIPLTAWDSLSKIRQHEEAQEQQILTSRQVQPTVPANALGLMSSQITTLTSRVNALESLNRARYAAEVGDLQVRYKNATNLLINGVRDLQGLQTLADMVSLFQTLDSLGNPNTYPQFLDGMTALSKELPNESKGVLGAIANFIGGPPTPASTAVRNLALSNPVTSAIFSVATMFVSKSPDAKSQNAAPLWCVVNITTSAQASVSALNNSVAQLQAHAVTAESSMKVTLAQHLLLANYRQSWDNLYPSVVRNAAILDSIPASLFSRLLSDTSAALGGPTASASADIQSIRSSLYSARLALDSREGVVREFGRMLDQVDSLANNAAAAKCTADATVTQLIVARAASVSSTLKMTRGSFDSTYVRFLPQPVDLQNLTSF